MRFASDCKAAANSPALQPSAMDCFLLSSGVLTATLGFWWSVVDGGFACYGAWGPRLAVVSIRSLEYILISSLGMHTPQRRSICQGFRLAEGCTYVSG